MGSEVEFQMKSAIFEKLKRLEKKHTAWRRDCINLIASENVTSHDVRNRLISDFGNRYVNTYAPTLSSEWRESEQVKWYEGLDYVEKVERTCYDLMKRVFRANFADYRPISGEVAVVTNWFAFSEINDVIMRRSRGDGGHALLDELASMTGRKVVDLPFDAKEYAIDVDDCRRKIIELKPKVVYFGGSNILFPEALKQVMDSLTEVGAHAIYDGSHVMGLIASGKFQDPLREGVSSLFGSTHKTLPGPQGGMTVSNAGPEIANKLDRTLLGSLIDNYHQNRVAALTLALFEIIKFGAAYASQIVANSKALGSVLCEEGFPVLCEHKGFSESHQVIMDLSRLKMDARKAAEKLAKSNIIANRCPLPGDPNDKASGIRLGVQEMTRVGMRESEMRGIGELFRRCLIDRKRAQELRREVTSFKRKYTKIHYSINEGSEAYPMV
jgi:glycine hydroxymethyltransferase